MVAPLRDRGSASGVTGDAYCWTSHDRPAGVSRTQRQASPRPADRRARRPASCCSGGVVAAGPCSAGRPCRPAVDRARWSPSPRRRVRRPHPRRRRQRSPASAVFPWRRVAGLDVHGVSARSRRATGGIARGSSSRSAATWASTRSPTPATMTRDSDVRPVLRADRGTRRGPLVRRHARRAGCTGVPPPPAVPGRRCGCPSQATQRGAARRPPSTPPVVTHSDGSTTRGRGRVSPVAATAGWSWSSNRSPGSTARRTRRRRSLGPARRRPRRLDRHRSAARLRSRRRSCRAGAYPLLDGPRRSDDDRGDRAARRVRRSYA